MVQIEPKLMKKATNPHNSNWDISNDPYSIPIDYELLEKVEKARQHDVWSDSGFLGSIRVRKWSN